MKTITKLFLIAVMGWGVSMPLAAQPSLDLKWIAVKWPTVELHFTVECNGQPVFDMQKQNFRVEEDGIAVQDFTLSCPDQTGRKPISVSLVMDASGSMSGSGNAGAKQAGHAFIDRMDGVVDEASILWFTQVVTIFQAMTTIKPLLHSAIDALPASGATAVWDGCYAGLIELVNNGVNPCRAVVLLTDGGDNSSTRTPAEIIDLGQGNGIRVYTVGLGSNINATELEMIALLTGGKYYQTPNAGQLSAIYAEIFTDILTCSDECQITYQSECADGGIRKVELFLENYCGGSESKTKSFAVPLDPTDYVALTMEFPDARLYGGGDITLPLYLRTPIQGRNLYPLEFRIHFDPQYLDFKSIAAPVGSIIEGMPFNIFHIRAGEVMIQSTQSKTINGSGLLAELIFTAADITAITCTTPSVTNASLAGGCMNPVFETGEICLHPRKNEPLLFCHSTAPDTLRWKVSQSDYLPNPFQVCAEFRNSGLLAAQQGAFALDYDTTVLELISSNESFPGAGNSIGVGEIATACYTFRARWQTQFVRADICITASFSNSTHRTCCESVYIEHAGPVFICAIDAPPIAVDSTTGQYDPMPFETTVTVTNIGGMAAGSTLVTLGFGEPYTLEFAQPDDPASATKVLQPQYLSPGSSGTVQYMVKHPIVDTLTEAWMHVSVNPGGAHCDYKMNIPGMPVSRFNFLLHSDEELEFCEGLSVQIDAPGGYDSYHWSTGDTTRSVLASKSGAYFCTAWYNGEIGFSDTLYVTVMDAPKPLIAVNGSIPLCPGDSLFLDAGTGYAAYFWSTRETTQSIVVHDPGEYHVTVTGINGCPGYSDTVTVTMAPDAAKPIITRDLDVLSSTDARTWQWYRNGQPMSGETNRNLPLLQPGTYVVFITDANGCTAMSDPFEVTVLDVEKVDGAALRFDLYPNPSGGVFTVALDVDHAQDITLTVTDMLGRQLYQHQLEGAVHVREHIDLSDFPPGSYLVRAALARRSVRRLLTLQ